MMQNELHELRKILNQAIQVYRTIDDSSRKILLVLLLQEFYPHKGDASECLRLLEDELAAAAADKKITLKKTTDNCWLFDAGRIYESWLHAKTKRNV